MSTACKWFVCLYRTRGWLALQRRHSVAEAGGSRWRRAAVSTEAKSLFKQEAWSRFHPLLVCPLLTSLMCAPVFTVVSTRWLISRPEREEAGRKVINRVFGWDTQSLLSYSATVLMSATSSNHSISDDFSRQEQISWVEGGGWNMDACLELLLVIVKYSKSCCFLSASCAEVSIRMSRDTG